MAKMFQDSALQDALKRDRSEWCVVAKFYNGFPESGRDPHLTMKSERTTRRAAERKLTAMGDVSGVVLSVEFTPGCDAFDGDE